MERRGICVTRLGGPEVMELRHDALPDCGAGEAQILQTHAGVNFVDTYHRSGQFGHDTPDLPFTPGVHGVGRVVALGPGAEGPAPGTRVTWVGGTGGYASARNIDAARLVEIPDAIDDATVAAILVRGLTAHYLTHRLWRIEPGQRALVHAAAGGLGQLLTAWATARGAEVIGTAGGPARCATARAAGAATCIDYKAQDFVAAVDDLTGGTGVDVVYDTVGRDTFLGSLDCLRPMGMAINCGTVSGQVEAFDLQRLHRKSLLVARPTLETFIRDPEDFRAGARAVWQAVGDGILSISDIEVLPLAAAPEAHRRLEGRQVAGALVLDCQADP